MFPRFSESTTRTPNTLGHVGKLTSQSRTPTQWLLVESKSKLMAPSPLQRVRVRTPSHLAGTPNSLTPSVQKFRVGSASCLTPVHLSIDNESPVCKTPQPVYQKVCSEYFRGLCKSKNCLESHDPGQVSRCIQFAAEGRCVNGDACWLRHDRPNQLDQRPLFDLNKYRELHNQRANELRKKLQEEDQKYRDEKRAIYDRDVYKHDPLDDTYKTLSFDEAMNELKVIKNEFFQKVEKPGPAENAPVIQIVRSDSTGEDDGIYSDEDSFDIDTESYFSKLVSWLNGLNITSWTAKQVYNFYEEATAKAGGLLHHCTELLNKMFKAFQPSVDTWAEVFSMINMEMSELVDTMHEWMKLPGITELHVGGLFAGLLKIKNKKWNLDKMSKVLLNTIASSQVSIGIICVSNRIPDGFFLLGLCKYLDIETSSKLFKFYLKSKEEKDEAECTCNTFVCSCAAIIEWDLYGIPLFRPIFDYLNWDISKKAELFGQSTEGVWIELEIKGVLEHILTDESDKGCVLKQCKPRETTEHTLQHLMLSGAFEDMPTLQELLIYSLKDTQNKENEGVSAKTSIPCEGFEKDIDGSTVMPCSGQSILQCDHKLCSKCCREKPGGPCGAHSHLESTSEGVMNAFYQLICTEDDEAWDYATFHSIKPAMTYDSVQEFEDSIATIDKESEKMKKVEFACAAEVTDDTVLKLTKTFGQTLEVLEFQTVNPGDFCKIKDVAVDMIVQSCPNLAKLRLVGCTEISSDAFIKIVHGCKKLQSLEVSGVAKFSGFLKDKCLEPLFDGALPELRFLNLLDQFFLHTATIDRLRRKRKELKIIIGERDTGEEGDILELMVEKAAHNPFTSEENFTEVY